MKKIVLLFTIMFVFTACPNFGKWAMPFHNNSNFEYIFGILDQDCTDNEVSVYSQSHYVHISYPYMFRSDERWDKVIKDSIEIYLLDPERIIGFNNFYINTISRDRASAINNHPECILAKYVFSIKQIKALDWSFSFPPDEKMKELGVLTTPSYEELNEKYRK